MNVLNVKEMDIIATARQQLIITSNYMITVQYACAELNVIAWGAIYCYTMSEA